MFCFKFYIYSKHLTSFCNFFKAEDKQIYKDIFCNLHRSMFRLVILLIIGAYNKDNDYYYKFLKTYRLICHECLNQDIETTHIVLRRQKHDRNIDKHILCQIQVYAPEIKLF